MPNPTSLLVRTRLIAFAFLAAVAGHAAASTSGVVISQVFGGNGGAVARDYVELFNAGTSPVSLTGWSVQYASAAGTGPFGNGVTALAGTLQPGQYYLVGLASSTAGAALPTPDASGSTNISGTAGKVILANVATGLACNGGSTPCSPAQLAQIVDLVGYGGTANFFEGASAAPAPSTTTAIVRAAGGCTDADHNGADFAVAAPAPRNSSAPLAPCGSTNQPIVPVCPATAQVASGAAVTLPLSASDADDAVSSATITSAAVAGITLADFVAAPGAGSAATVKLALDSAVAGGSYAVTVQFGNGRAQVASCNIALTVAPAGAYTPIPQIQGSGATSPLVGQGVTTRGVVTRVNNNGYFLQDPVGDGNPDTSDGLFVFTGAAPTVGAGPLVQVTGTVSEFNVGALTNALTAANPLTELVSPTATTLLGAGVVTPTPVTLPEATAGDWERYEGMLVSIGTPLTVSQNFFQGRYGQVTVSANGRLIKPTQLHRPNTPQALALADQNARGGLLLDDGSSQQNPSPIPYIGADNTLRAGDTLPGLVGVVDYGLATNLTDGLADWRLQPTEAPLITRANLRSAAPAAAPGNLKVASFNVLNYFTTFTDGQTAFGQSGQGCAPSGTTADCRGADNATEFTRQRTKIVAALAALDADVIGLMEIQNNGDVAAQHLADALNAVAGAGSFAVVPAPAVTGTDAIRVAMLYKPARVALVGGALADADAIHDRPPMAQAFRLLANSEVFSVVVNHFKSKRCTDAAGAELDQGDGQGCYNARRTLQSQRLLTFITSVQAAAGGDPDVLVIGDLNAYGQEDPVHALRGGGLVDQALRFDAAPYSYVFDGEAGTLDHGLATPALSAQVVAAAHWHINADEPSVIDYNTEFKPQDLYGGSVYRSSDHDPLVIALDLQPLQAQTILFEAPADQALGAAPFALVASASSGLPVSFASLTPVVCTVAGGSVTLVAIGTCTVSADQAGSASFLPAPQVQRSFAVRQAQVLSFAALAARSLADGGFVLSASASSGLPVSFVSTTPVVCGVSGNAVALLAVGTCSITASQGGDGTWAAATPVAQSFAVTAAVVVDEGDVPLPAWALALLAGGLAAGVRARARSGRSARLAA